jgi:hypothetical protein
MINVRDDRDVSNVLHIVNDRSVHVAKITGASNRCDRETLTEKSAAATWRIAGRVGCPFTPKGQARAKAKSGSSDQCRCCFASGLPKVRTSHEPDRYGANFGQSD